MEALPHSAEKMSPSWFCNPTPQFDVPAAFTPSSCSPAGVQASAFTWLLNLSLSCVLRPTSEGKLNILGAVCWCLYLIKCTDEVLIYCRAVFTLYYKEITQLEWDQAGNTEEISQFNSKEKTGAWRRLEEGGLMGWRVGDYRGGLSWHKHDNIQGAWCPFNTAASVLINRQLPVRGSADELEFNKAQTEEEDSQTTSNKWKKTIHLTRGCQENSGVLK